MSTYTPFFRRFKNEKARELAETQALYERVKGHNFSQLGVDVYPYPDEILKWPIGALIIALLEELTIAPPEFQKMDMEQFVQYRNRLHRLDYLGRNYKTLKTDLWYLLDYMAVPCEENSPFGVPLWSVHPNLKQAIQEIHNFYGKWKLELAEQLNRNAREVFGKKEVVAVVRTEMEGKDLLAFVKGTPFYDFLHTPIPLPIPFEVLREHVHLLGRSGTGKTLTIERLMLWLQSVPERPTVVLIDPHSVLPRRMAKVNFGYDPLIIDPRDAVHHNIALNIFSPSKRMGQYDQVTKEKVTTSAIDTFINLFQNLQVGLTGKQESFFRSTCRLLLSFPEIEGRNATIRDMFDLMRLDLRKDLGQFKRAIEALEDFERDFFMLDFMEKNFDGTREQLKYRLKLVIDNQTMRRIFCSEETKVDFYEELQKGEMIIIDCASDFLGEAGAADFGKFMISLILKAIMERAAIEEHEKKPVMIFIDEAHNFFSRDINTMLESVRKHNAGVLLAHHSLSQTSAPLAGAIHANTRTKLANPSAEDASKMATALRTTSEFLLKQGKWHFATFIGDVTPTAVSLYLPPVEGIPQRDDYEQLLERNRKRVSGPPKITTSHTRPEADEPPVPQNENPDFSKEW